MASEYVSNLIPQFYIQFGQLCVKKLSISRQLSGRLSKNLIFSLPIIGATINVKIQIHTMRNLNMTGFFPCRYTNVDV